jgi:hypothetical protein
MDWIERFDLELTNAERARSRRKEGQARVCARRAAGIVVTEYLTQQGSAPRTGSAMDVLRQLRNRAGTSLSAQAALEKLVLPVDEEFKLPPGIDLIAEARLLRDELLPPL